MYIKYYDSAGSEIAYGGVAGTNYIENINNNGGWAPDAGGMQDDKMLLYFGCGPGNLEAQSDNTDLRPSAFSNWAYYTIQGFD